MRPKHIIDKDTKSIQYAGSLFNKQACNFSYTEYTLSNIQTLHDSENSQIVDNIIKKRENENETKEQVIQWYHQSKFFALAFSHNTFNKQYSPYVQY